MIIEILIILLLIGIAIILCLKIWKSAEAKIYDPNAVDFSDTFDPQHDHFSKEHARKSQQAIANKSIPRATQPPSFPDNKRTTSDMKIRASSERRSKQERRHEDRRNSVERREVQAAY